MKSNNKKKVQKGMCIKTSGIKLYGHYFSMHLKSSMQYKASFLMTCIGQFLVSFNVFLGVFFMFQRFHKVDKFSYEDALLCFGIFLMAFSLAECFFRGFDSFSSIIRNGEFDRIMVRPRNNILQVLGSRIEFTRIGRILQSIVMLTYAIIKRPLDWNVGKVLTVIAMILGGAVIFSGLFLIYASLCFFTLEGLEFMNIFTDGAREFGKYPINIYGKRIFQLCTFIIPYTLVQFYPLLYLLDKGKWWYSLMPLMACLFIIPCLVLWRIGVRHYQSNGS